MKQVSLAFCLIALVSSSTLAQSQKELADQLQKSVAETYKDKTMRTLDEKKLLQGPVLVRIVHSLMEGKGSVVRRSFKTFAQFDAWLKKREREEGSPFRQVSELVKCSKGHCEYNYDNGILHNQLYLHDIYYRFRNGKPYIFRIDLLDGD
ncbi:MAG TPA: hypothetical protein VHQ64_05570 [Pyrinomonadaceae bacterium]|nr:hypothetical protein [Pyrinomonadaceae bacterium]